MNQPLINVERKFRPEIEGLRVVAALLVAIYHIWFNRVSGGVDVFFVVSGFLITTSIISTINRTGEYRFWPYISQLMKRLLPSTFFILGLTLILSLFLLPASIFEKTIREVFASMFYYQNWQLALSNTDYLDASQMKTPVEHFWALSIQGQFYIVWFSLFTFILFLIRKYKLTNARKLINVAFSILFVASLLYSIYLTELNQQWAYFITFTRVWEFALGGLLCINLSAINVNKVVADIIGWLGLIGLILTGILFNVSDEFPGYIALWPMICAISILLSGTRNTTYNVKRFLGSPLMVKLGGISFGIYLWHWVLLAFYRYNIQQTPSLIAGILIIVVSFFLSALMTRFIEKPIRNSDNNLFSFKRLIILGSVNVLLIGCLFTGIYIEQNKAEQDITDNHYPGAQAADSQVNAPDQEAIPTLSKVFDDLPQSHLDDHNQSLDDSDLKIGEYGETQHYEATIAVIGSSHSEQWLGAVLEAAKHHDYRVLSITRSGTRFTTGYPEAADSKYGESKAVWVNHVLDYLSRADIDLVIAQATVSDSDNHETQQEMIDQLQYVQDEYGIDSLALRDNPRYSFNVLESLETNGLKKTTKKMNADKEKQQDESFWTQFEQNNTSLNKMDLTQYFKMEGQFQPVIGNVRIYRDENHITNTYAKSFGPIFEEKINKVLEEQ